MRKEVSKLPVDGTKYCVIHDPPGIPNLVQRHGEEWRRILGDKFIGRLVSEAASSRDILVALEQYIDCKDSDDYVDKLTALIAALDRHHRWGFTDSPATMVEVIVHDEKDREPA